MRYYSLVKLRGATGQSLFAFDFPYLKREDVRVFVDGTSVSFTFTSPNTIELTTPLTKASDVVIRRFTETGRRLVDYNSVAELTEEVLDMDSLQAFYIVQEALDTAASAVVADIQGNWDAKRGRIINVADPVDDTDAMNRRTFFELNGAYTSKMEEWLRQARVAVNDAVEEANRARDEANRAADIQELTQAIHDGTAEIKVEAERLLTLTVEERIKAEAAVVASKGWADKSAYWYDVFRSIYLGLRSEHPGGEVVNGAVYFNTTDNRLYFYTGTQWYSPTTDADRAEAARRFVESMRNEVSNMRDQTRVYSQQTQDFVTDARDAANAAGMSAGVARNEAAAASNHAQAAEISAGVANERASAADGSAKLADAAAGRAEAAAAQVGETFGDRGGWYVAHGMPTKPMRSALWTVMDGGELNGVEWNAGDMLVYSIKTNSFGRITGTSITPSEPSPIEAEEGLILGDGKFIRARVAANIRWIAHANSEGVKLGDNAVELHLLGNNMVFGALKHPVFHKGNLPTWDDVTGKPSSFPVVAHSHKWDEITGKPAAALRWPTWFEVTDKPTYFPPVSHTHSWNEISNKPDTALRWPTAAEAGARPSDWVPSWGDVTGKPATATRWPTPAEVGAAVRIPLNLSSSTTGRRSCRLLTIGLTDNSASFMVTAQGDFGQRERGWYFVSIATRGSVITINTYLLNGFQADPLRLFWKNTGSAFEVWGEFSDYNNNNYLFPLGEHGATYNVDNMGTARDWTGFTEVAVNRIYTTNDKPTAADVLAVPVKKAHTQDWTSAPAMQGKQYIGGYQSPDQVASYMAFGAGGGSRMDFFIDGDFYANEGRSRVYHEGFNPTADAVGALSVNGGVVKGPVTVLKDTHMAFIAERGEYQLLAGISVKPGEYLFGGKAVASADYEHYIRIGSNLFQFYTNGATHTVYTSANKPSAADVKARPDNWVPSWGDVTGKPETFPPATHSHSAADVGAMAKSVGTVGGHDWNTLTTPGSYGVSNMTGPNKPSIPGLPSVYPYGTLLVQSNGLTISQLYITDGNKIYLRDKFNTNGWGTWTAVSNDEAIPINTSIDLNTLTYSCTYDMYKGTGVTFTNAPGDFSYGSLQVIGRGQAPASFVTQILTWHDDGRQMIRTRTDGSFNWGPWKKIYSESQKPTPGEIGAAALNHGHSRQFGSEQTLSTEDLDTIKIPGVYAQHANANTSAARHYPENLAGSLIVTVGAGVQQRYHVYNTSRIWTRAQYDQGAWTPWALEYNTLNKPTAADVGLSNVPNTVHTTAPTANTVAVRDSAGDLTARLMRSNYQNESVIPAGSQLVFRIDTSNNYLRFCSNPAAVREWLGAGPTRYTNVTVVLASLALVSGASGTLSQDVRGHEGRVTIVQNGYTQSIYFRWPVSDETFQLQIGNDHAIFTLTNAGRTLIRRAGWSENSPWTNWCILTG